MLCPIGQSNEKPPLQVLAKWREYVTGDSEHRADFTCLDDTCEEWEGIEDAQNMEHVAQI